MKILTYDCYAIQYDRNQYIVFSLEFLRYMEANEIFNCRINVDSFDEYEPLCPDTGVSGFDFIDEIGEFIYDKISLTPALSRVILVEDSVKQLNQIKTIVEAVAKTIGDLNESTEDSLIKILA